MAYDSKYTLRLSLCCVCVPDDFRDMFQDNVIDICAIQVVHVRIIKADVTGIH